MANSTGDLSARLPVVFVLDCDNTLLDNDSVKEGMDSRLREIVGQEETERFWKVYEDVRATSGTVNLPATFEKFREGLASSQVMDAVIAAIMEYPFSERLFPETMEVIAALKRWGLPVIVSDGDSYYQPRKIIQSGLARAVDDNWVVYIHKEDHLDEIMRRWPGAYYVMVDDKARILAETKRRDPERFVTVHVVQGHYAREEYAPAPDVTVQRLRELLDLDLESMWTYLGG